MPLRLLQFSGFASTLDRFSMAPMLLSVARAFDVPLAAVLPAAGAYFLTYGLMQPLWGAFSDRVGLVRTMRLTLLLAGVAAVASAFSVGPVSLGISRALAGGFMAAVYPACLIYLGDTVGSTERQQHIARLMVGIALGTAVASVGAGALAAAISWRATFVVTGLLAFVVAFALRTLSEPPAVRRGRGLLRPVGRVLRSPMTVIVLVLAFVEGGALLGGLTLVPPALESAGADTAVSGLAAGAYGLAVLIGAAVVGRLAGRTHPATLIAVGAAAAVTACLLLTASQAVVLGALAAALFGLSWTSMHSSLQTWATDVLPDDRAVVVSMFAGSLFCGSALAAVLVRGAADEGRYGVIFGITAAVCVALGLVATIVRARWSTGSSDAAPQAG